MMPDMFVTFVEFELEQKWSPKQIAGVGKIIGNQVSHEWIYGYAKRDKQTVVNFIKSLATVDVSSVKAIAQSV